MSITSAIVLYIVTWALVFYMVNPFGQRSQREAGEVVPGTPEGAPSDPQLRKKALITTAIATVAFLVIYTTITLGWLSLEDVTWITPPSLRPDGD